MIAQMTARQAMADITAYLSEKLPRDVALGARLKFVYPGTGVVFIDGVKTPSGIHNRDEAADCTVEIDPVLHLQLLHREVDQGLAFRQGRMKISGDVAIAVRLGPLLAASSAQSTH
jgi:putative sterol carrier protein